MEKMMPTYPTEHVIDPIYDEGFKLIFGREDVSERLILDLLNSIFVNDPELGNIVNVRFTNTEKPNETIGGKGIRYDIRCTTSTGHHFIVEMQKAEQIHFMERCVYYVSRDTAEQGFKGRKDDCEEWDFSLMPVVGLFFTNFHVRELSEKPLVYGRLVDEETGQPMGDYQRYVFIQLPCFHKSEEDCDTQIDKWIYNIKNMGNTQTVAFKSQSDIFDYLHSVSNVAALDKNERDLYEAALMRARDYNAQMKTARIRGHEQGFAMGIAEGRAEGRAEGIAEGRAEGRAEGLTLTAKKMLEKGYDIATVADITGLSEEDIAHLKD